MRIDRSALRLGFAGTPQFALPALDALNRMQPLCAVFTQPDRPAGRGRPLNAGPVKALAIERGIPVYQPASFRSPQALEILRSLELDVLVVVAYGLLLPAAAIASPKKGCINLHASLLPRWRGAAPIQRALLAGDGITGVTIMRMEPELDTGPTMAARTTYIGPLDTAHTLQDRLARLGAALLSETLDELLAGRVREVPQPAEGVTYAKKITKAEALIDWRRDAQEIWRSVRAFNPWPIAETRFNGAQLRIWDAQMGDASRPSSGEPGAVLAATHDGIDVACGSGVLRVLRLQLAGRKPVSAQEFIRGQRLDGARFAAP